MRLQSTSLYSLVGIIDGSNQAITSGNIVYEGNYKSYPVQKFVLLTPLTLVASQYFSSFLLNDYLTGAEVFIINTVFEGFYTFPIGFQMVDGSSTRFIYWGSGFIGKYDLFSDWSLDLSLYYDPNDYICHESCLSCDPSTPDICTSCKYGNLLANTKCYPDCSFGGTVPNSYFSVVLASCVSSCGTSEMLAGNVCILKGEDCQRKEYFSSDEGICVPASGCVSHGKFVNPTLKYCSGDCESITRGIFTVKFQGECLSTNQCIQQGMVADLASMTCILKEDCQSPSFINEYNQCGNDCDPSFLGTYEESVFPSFGAVYELAGKCYRQFECPPEAPFGYGKTSIRTVVSIAICSSFLTMFVFALWKIFARFLGKSPVPLKKLAYFQRIAQIPCHSGATCQTYASQKLTTLIL